MIRVDSPSNEVDLLRQQVSTLRQILQALERTVLEQERRLQARNRELEANLEKLSETQDALMQSTKMAAIGQLAAGVAHEINNPLAVILGFAQGLEKRLPEAGQQLRTPISSIVREAVRCRNLVQELLTFSRTGLKSREPLDLHEVVRSAGHLLESRARTQDTSMQFELMEEVPLIRGNKTQLEQVIINLGNNALDALRTGGCVVLRIVREPGTHVTFEVEDTGPGMAESVQRRIFEPFYTTKEVGKGTGLGLSLAYEIVQQHGGTIDVESEAGKGTTMRVRLPALAASQMIGVGHEQL